MPCVPWRRRRGAWIAWVGVRPREFPGGGTGESGLPGRESDAVGSLAAAMRPSVSLPGWGCPGDMRIRCTRTERRNSVSAHRFRRTVRVIRLPPSHMTTASRSGGKTSTPLPASRRCALRTLRRKITVIFFGQAQGSRYPGWMVTARWRVPKTTNSLCARRLGL